VRRIWLAAVVTAFAALSTASAAEWRTSTYESDGFAVDFSGNVTVSPMELDEATKKLTVRSTHYLQDGGAYAYLVAVMLLSPDATLDMASAVKAAMQAYDCKKVASDNSSKTSEADVRELFASQCFQGSHKLGARYYGRGQWFYQVVYLVPGDEQIPDGKRFLTSFKLLPVKQ
jgi:hypothetical protein